MGDGKMIEMDDKRKALYQKSITNQLKHGVHALSHRNADDATEGAVIGGKPILLGDFR